MSRQRIAREQQVHEPGIDQRDHGGSGPGVHDRRTADPQDLLALRLDPAEILGDEAHLQGLRLLAGHHRVHELEMAVVGVHPQRLGDDPDPTRSDDH